MNVKLFVKRRMHGIIVFTLALSVLATACSKNSNTGNSSNSASSSSSATSTPSTTQSAGMSPTETLKAYYDAAKRKDVQAVKKFLSRGTMQVMEDLAKERGKTVDQMFNEGAERDAQMPMPEFTNERVNGENATVDIKAPGQPMVTMEMVKEDGAWKLAIDKMMNRAPSPGEKSEGESHDNGNH